MAKNAPSAAARVAQQPAAPAELFRNSAIPYIAIALAVGGIALGFILTRNFFQHTVVGGASGCAINSYVDCDRISQSAFAAVGPVPISAFGLGMHVAVLAALAVAHFSRARVREGLVGGTAVLALAATAVSVVLAVISLFVIRALCVYCTALQIVNLALAGTLVFGLTGGAERLKQAAAVRSPARRSELRRAGRRRRNAGAAAIATYGLSTGADRQLLEQQILEARESQRLAAQQLQEQRIADVRAARQLQEQQFAEARATQRFADLFLSRKRYESAAGRQPAPRRSGRADHSGGLSPTTTARTCHYFDPRIAARSRARPPTCGWCTSSTLVDATCNRLFAARPLSNSTSCAAAAGAYLAHLEGKFWEYNDTLFANFQRYGPNRLVALCPEGGSERSGESPAPRIGQPEGAEQDQRRHLRRRTEPACRGTPTLYINGRQVPDQGPCLRPTGR